MTGHWPKPVPWLSPALAVTSADQTAPLPKSGGLKVVRIFWSASNVNGTWGIWDPKKRDWLRGKTGARRAWSLPTTCQESLWQEECRREGAGT